MALWVWLISLNIVISNSIHFPANDIILFFFMKVKRDDPRTEKAVQTLA
jgi:hypothetical protein